MSYKSTDDKMTSHGTQGRGKFGAARRTCRSCLHFCNELSSQQYFQISAAYSARYIFQTRNCFNMSRKWTKKEGNKRRLLSLQEIDLPKIVAGRRLSRRGTTTELADYTRFLASPSLGNSNITFPLKAILVFF